VHFQLHSLVVCSVLLQLFKDIISEMNLEPEDVFLAQGTLRPDLIESASLLASSNAHVIKTHHNDTQLVRQLREEVCRIHIIYSYHFVGNL